ncbi:MAG: hypothetical protein KDK99_05215, partial [Verrucomicrobiales bacterium]|nr:hypothetical protein [Verrucomicrobiales bacterium]
MSRRLVSRLGLLMVALATANAPAGIARIEIEPLWKGVPINQPDLWLERSGHDEISLSRLDFLLSEPVVEDAAGRRFTRANWFQLVSLTDPAEPVLIDELPDLPISAIEFTVGVSDAINAADPNQWPPSHPLHPQRSNLHWSWQGGYIFFAVEGRWRDVDAAQTGGFAFHLGNAPHRMRVRLKVEAPLAAPQTIRLGLNLEAILGDTASLDLTEQVSTHGREGDALAMNLKRNVEEAFSVETVEPLQLASFQKNAVPDGSAIGTPYRFTISRGFPIPRLPTDYPLTEERVALGRRLFADGQLSRDGRVSCASCHPAATAFADPQVFSIGLDGQKTPRHSMPLLNLAWKHA